MPGEGAIEVEGRIVEVLGEALYRVELANGHRLLGHVSSRNRAAFGNLPAGRRVKVLVSPYDLSKGGITAAME